MKYGYFGSSDNPDATGPNATTIAQPPIILRAPEELQYPQIQQQFPYSQTQQQSPLGRPIQPEDIVRGSRSWKKDPAYRVLFIAIGVVLLSSLACVTVLAGVFNQPTPQSAQRGGTNPPQVANTGSINTTTPTPIPTPTPILAPTQPPVIGPFTVQITNKLPNKVQNNTTVRVAVTTSEPGAKVHLSVVYKFNGMSFATTQTQPQNTDNQGNTTISWRIPRMITTVTAQVTAIAQNQQGQQVTSQSVTVQISNNR